MLIDDSIGEGEVKYLLEKRFNIEKLHYDAYKGSGNDNVFLNKRRGVINRAKTPRVCNVFATTFRVTP